MAKHKFIGKERLLKRMKEIPVRVRIEAREALNEQAAFLVENIRPNVPREHGDLADSLNWKPNPRMDKIGVIITEGANDDTLGRKARAVEFGRPESAEAGAMEAQPHFFPTYRALRRRMKAAVNRRIRNVVKRIWGSGK